MYEAVKATISEPLVLPACLVGTGQKGVSDENGGVTNRKVLSLSGVEVQLPMFGPAGTDVKGISENIIAVTGEGLVLRHLHRGGCLLVSDAWRQSSGIWEVRGERLKMRESVGAMYGLRV